MAASELTLDFFCALEDREIKVLALRGHEGISELYEFELLIGTFSEDSTLGFEDVQTILEGGVYVEIDSDDFQNRFCGILRELTILPSSLPEETHYRAIMVPMLWRTTQVFRSAIYQQITVPKIIESVLTQVGLTADEDYDLDLSGTYEELEYVVQYEETDFNFISRLMEDLGIFYWFDHSYEAPDSGKLVIRDSASMFLADPDNETVRYHPMAPIGEQTVTALACRRRMLPKDVKVVDYHYLTPTLEIVGEATVDDKGIGKHCYQAGHSGTATAATTQASLRAGELASLREIYRGQSSCRWLRCGHKISLEYDEVEPHFEFPVDYIITSVEHDIDETSAYSNSFMAVDGALDWKPLRKTRKPRVPGLTHGVVEGVVGTATPIDEYGRYRVRCLFEHIDSELASTWIRMAQPAAGGYDGQGHGFHFPLHSGTEVVLNHLNGDPDRPVIVGALPNPSTASPVVQETATRAVFRTRGGVVLEFDDDS